MDTYFISYDLIKHKDYPRIIAELERMGGVRILESVWAIKKASTTSKELYDHLCNFIDGDDRILIVKSRGWTSVRTLATANDI